MTTRPIVALWQEVLERRLTAADVPVVEAEVGVRMMGWYRGLPTLGVKSLARAGDDSALLRVRALTPDITLFEATSTLPTQQQFLAERANVLAVVAMLTDGPAEPRMTPRVDLFELAHSAPSLRDPLSVSRDLVRLFERVAKASRRPAPARRGERLRAQYPTRPLDIARLWLASEELAATVGPLEFVLEQLAAQGPGAAQLRAAAERTRRSSPGLLAPRLWKAVTQVDAEQVRAAPEVSPGTHLFDLIEHSLAAIEASRTLPRREKKRVRTEVRARLEATVFGYATLARAARSEDRTMLLVGHALIQAAAKPGPRTRARPYNRHDV